MKAAQRLALRGPRPPLRQEVGPSRSPFLGLLQLAIRRALRPVFLLALPIQGLRGLLCLGSFSVGYVKYIEGPPNWGPTL